MKRFSIYNSSSCSQIPDWGLGNLTIGSCNDAIKYLEIIYSAIIPWIASLWLFQTKIFQKILTHVL